MHTMGTQTTICEVLDLKSDPMRGCWYMCNGIGIELVMPYAQRNKHIIVIEQDSITWLFVEQWLHSVMATCWLINGF